jgi:hypothetical protein
VKKYILGTCECILSKAVNMAFQFMFSAVIHVGKRSEVQSCFIRQAEKIIYMKSVVSFDNFIL